MVSVIVPAYNASQHICKCLTSICAAAEKNHDVEMIVVDDGSTDDTALKIENFKASSKANIKLISKVNGGVSSARNLGLANANGEWIMFVDADDELCPNAFDVIIPLLIEESCHDATGLMFSYIVRRFNNYSNVLFENKIIELSDVLNARSYNGILDTLLCTVWNKVYSGSVIHNNHIQFPENVNIGEDFIFNTLYYRHIDAVRLISTPLYNYNCYNDQSAIGKFYPNFDFFIHSMASAYNSLLAYKQIVSPEALAVRNKFIADRWLFATQRCAESSISFFKKNDILTRWYSTTDKIYLESVVKAVNNKYHILVKAFLKKRTLFPALLKLMMKDFYASLKSDFYHLFKSK